MDRNEKPQDDEIVIALPTAWYVPLALLGCLMGWAITEAGLWAMGGVLRALGWLQ